MDTNNKTIQTKETTMIDFDEVAIKLAKAEADNKVLRKKLDIAVDALKLFDSGQYTPQPDSYGLKTDASRLARKTLYQITALEQKDK